VKGCRSTLTWRGFLVVLPCYWQGWRSGRVRQRQILARNDQLSGTSLPEAVQSVQEERLGDANGRAGADVNGCEQHERRHVASFEQRTARKGQ
jgi:hypothetical protein